MKRLKYWTVVAFSVTLALMWMVWVMSFIPLMMLIDGDLDDLSWFWKQAIGHLWLWLLIIGLPLLGLEQRLEQRWGIRSGLHHSAWTAIARWLRLAPQ